MKILNTGIADFIVADSKGNIVVLKTNETVDVSQETIDMINKVPSYSAIKVVEEKKSVKKKIEVKENKNDTNNNTGI